MALTDVQARAAIQKFHADHLAYEGGNIQGYLNAYQNEVDYGRTVDYAYEQVIESLIMRALAYGNALPGYSGSPLRDDALEAAFNNASSTDIINFTYPTADAATKQQLAAALDNGSLKGFDVVNAMALLTTTTATPSADAVKQVAGQIDAGTLPSPQQVSDAINGVVPTPTVPTVPTPPVEVNYPKATLDLHGISDSNASFLTALYVGAFNRAPENGGLDYWINELSTLLKSGLNAQQAYQTLGQSLYQAGTVNGEGGTSLSNDDFIKYAYENSLGRQPDAGGFAYWQNELATGAIQRSDFLTTFLTAALEGAVDGAYLQARVAVAKFVAQENVSGDKSPGVNLKTILSTVKDEATAKTAIAGIEATYGKLTLGTEGVDHITLNGSPSSYDLKIDDNYITYTSGGVKQVLIGVERLDFTDGTHLAVDLSGNAGQAYRLYNAAFDRAPDKGGLGYWIDAADKGMSLGDMAASFATSNEFIGLYGATHTHSEFLNKLYTNVLDRPADSGGLSYWQNQLDTGAMTESQVLVSFSESAENKIAVVGQIQNGIDYSLHA